MRQNILLVRLSSLGDVVHALPVLETLRAAFPDARIDWLVEQQWQELVELHPALTNVIPVDTRAWRRAPFKRSTWKELRSTLRALRRGRYDVALDLQGLYKSSLLAFAGGVKKRLGFDVSSLKEPGASIFYTGQVAQPGAEHVVEKNLALAAALDAKKPVRNFCLPTTTEDENYVEEQLQKEGVKEFFVISPGGGWDSKCWPVERYAELHNYVAQESGWRCFLNIGPGEETLRTEFLSKNPAPPPVYFPLTLRQLVVLLKRAKVFVSGDTGPLHLAAAVGTPVVALFGPTDPARNGPYAKDSSRAVVLHHNELGIRTYKHERETSPAMLAISVEEAQTAVDRVLEASGE